MGSARREAWLSVGRRASRQAPRALFFAAALLCSLPCGAQPAGGAQGSAAEEERRTRLFKEGKAAADAGQWVEAAEKFRKVVGIRSAPKALIALGVAEEHLGRLVAALAAYKQAREEAADKALADELKTANAALDSIKPRVPRLLFSPAETAEGAQIEVDGVPVKLASGALLVDPGEHAIAATAAGKGTFRTTATVKESETFTVTLTFGADGSPTATATSSVDAPSGGAPRPPTGAVVIGLAGIVAAAVGGALYGLGSGQYTEADKQCPGAGCTAGVLASGNGGRTQMIAGDILIGAGAAALAGAGVWWVASATSKKKDATPSLFIAPRMGGVGVGGRF